MSIGAMGVVGSVAGAPLAQRSAETDHVQAEQAAQQRQIQSSRQAEAAAGVGATDEDQEASDRDADGRRLWEEQLGPGQPPMEGAADPPPAPRDPTGNSGTQLDLSA